MGDEEFRSSHDGAAAGGAGCGGIDSLSDALSVSTQTLELMRIGEEEIPRSLFTQIVGLLLEATATRQGKRTPDSNDGGRKDRRQ